MGGVIIAVMTMFDNLRLFFYKLREEWEDLMWKISDERQELAHLRITAHQLAMKEGRNSPYTHPDDYTENWTPLKKLQPISTNF